MMMKNTTKRKLIIPFVIRIPAYFKGLSFFLSITKGIAEKASKAKVTVRIAKRSTWSGVLKAIANGCR